MADDTGDVEDNDDRLSLVAAVGYNVSTCGYCTAPGSGQRSNKKSSKSYGIWAHFITPHAYQALLNRGWRRSGHYIYRPDNGDAGTCCPQVGIRLDAEEFRPKKQHRRAIANLQRAVRIPNAQVNGAEDGVKSSREASNSIASSSKLPAPQPGRPNKGKYTREWDIEREWAAVEWATAIRGCGQVNDLLSSDASSTHAALVRYHTDRADRALALRKGKGKERAAIEPPLASPCRRLETSFCLAQGTDEKYALFRKYQMKIHGESEEKVSSRKGFERFLCKAPLMSTFPGTTAIQQSVKAGEAVDVASSEPIPYDLYHMEWRLDGQLIAVGVLDVLPESLSSVYLFYDPDYKDLELGKVSVLREIALVKQLRRKRGMAGLRYYNLGLYIHKSPKMRYKAQYKPAQLLDSETCTWEYLDDVREALEQDVRYDWRKRIGQGGVKSGTAGQIGPSPPQPSAPSNDSSETDSSSDDEDLAMPSPPPPGILDPAQLSPMDLARTHIFQNGKVSLLGLTPGVASNPATGKQIVECVAALGPISRHFCLVL